MLSTRLAAALFSILTIAICPGVGVAQNYPTKTVRIIMGEPGGGPDLVARLIARGIAIPFGQQVIVENRSGSIAVEAAAKAPPDGYTLLFFGPTAWLLPLLRSGVPWDPIRDFAAVSLAVHSPNMLVVHPSLPVRSVKELIALSKARPGELNYASGAAGGSNHLAAELFKSVTGVNIVRVPYKGTVSALVSVSGGETHLMFPDAGTGSPQVKAGRLRALAVTSLEPSSLAPNLPTMSASGLPGFESRIILGMFAPTGTPASVTNLLHQEIVRVLNSADAKERLFSAGVEAVASSPEQFTATIKSEVAKWGKLIKDAGIREQ